MHMNECPHLPHLLNDLVVKKRGQQENTLYVGKYAIQFNTVKKKETEKKRNKNGKPVFMKILNSLCLPHLPLSIERSIKCYFL